MITSIKGSLQHALCIPIYIDTLGIEKLQVQALFLPGIPAHMDTTAGFIMAHGKAGHGRHQARLNYYSLATGLDPRSHTASHQAGRSGIVGTDYIPLGP